MLRNGVNRQGNRNGVVKQFLRQSNNCLMQVLTTGYNQSFAIGLSVISTLTTYIAWGDGSDTAINYSTSENYQVYTHIYATPGYYIAVIFNKSNIKSLYVSDNQLLKFMSIDGMNLTYLFLSATYTTVIGDISQMKIKALFLASSAGIQGIISSIYTLIWLYIGGATNVSGSISGKVLTYLTSDNANTYGDLATSSRLTRLYLSNSINIKLPTEGLVFGDNLTQVYISQKQGFTSNETDALIKAAAQATWSGVKIFICAGNNPRSAASNADVSILIGKMVSVTVNNPT